jgi:16S rRNA (cytosine1402-N4)-methyltransferase
MFDVGLLDLGVSSPQLDQSQRGFSFMHDGPMDMRMNQAEEITAQKLLQECAEDELIELFTKYGEIYRPQRVVRAIIADRSKKDFSSTLDFANMVARIEGWRRKGYHPATQYFQALRIAVNGELRHLENALLPLLHGLKPKGRLAVLTFHSLEDRIVKNCFKSLPDFGRPLTKKVVKTSWQESKENSRARSAKLRVFERSETRGEKR